MTMDQDQGMFTDMIELEKALAEDASGNRARELVAYFETLLHTSEEILQKQIDQSERQLALQLGEAFRAAQRIVRDVWESMHSASLPA